MAGRKEFLEAGKRRLAGDTARAATSDEVKDPPPRSASALKRGRGRSHPRKPTAQKSYDRGWGRRVHEDIPHLTRQRSSGWSSNRPLAGSTDAGKARHSQIYRFTGGMIRYFQPPAGPEVLADRPLTARSDLEPDPGGCPRCQIVDLALDQPELSPRELAVRFTDEEKYFVSEASGLSAFLKAHDLITSPAYISSSKRPRRSRTRPRRPTSFWQTDFTYLKITGWGWYYLSTVLDDFSRFIVAWKLCATMKAQDVTATLRSGVGGVRARLR